LRQLQFQFVIERLNLVLELADQAIFHRLGHGPVNRTTVLSLPRMTITSRHNPLVARFRDAARGDAGAVMLLDGPHLVADALAAGVVVTLAAVTPASAAKPHIHDLPTAPPHPRITVATPTPP